MDNSDETESAEEQIPNSKSCNVESSEDQTRDGSSDESSNEQSSHHCTW